MHPEMERIQNCLAAVRRHTDFVPEVAVVLGSGLGGFADMVKQAAVVPYSEIPGFPVSTAPGHAGRFVFGYVEETPVVVMQGRVHLYEGYTPHDVVLPVRLMNAMGAKILFVTNASGGIRGDLTAGTLMSISDHISALIPNPLIGANIEELGPRFPDMSEVYDRELSKTIRDTAARLDIPVQEGVYCQLTGPTYETPAEIKMLGLMGADSVGMSTACEAAAARHAGMRVCGISCITNLAAGISPVVLSHQEVFATANRVAPFFRRLVRESIEAMVEAL